MEDPAALAAEAGEAAGHSVAPAIEEQGRHAAGVQQDLLRVVEVGLPGGGVEGDTGDLDQQVVGQDVAPSQV